MKLVHLHEAMYTDQLTGVYLVTLTYPLLSDFKQPLYDKTNKALLVSANEGLGNTPRYSSVVIAVFGTNPYERLKRFIEQHFGEQLDDPDFGVDTYIEKSDRITAKRNFGDIEPLIKKVQNALKRAIPI